MTLAQAHIIDHGVALQIRWPDGTAARFHAIWLRDNALDPETRAPGNGQRLISVLDIPDDTRIESASVDESGGLVLRFAPDGKGVAFPADWLRERIYDRAAPDLVGWTDPAIVRWGSELAEHIPIGEFATLCEERGALGDWLGAVRCFGFAKLTGVPQESGAVASVAELFGHVRETNYGRWFDVRAEVDPINLAYTGLGLPPHTDNPYRDPTPTLQLLACLESSAEGGDSVVVDGFKAAAVLQDEMPTGFDLLARRCARFEFAGDTETRLRAKRPMIELGVDGELIAVRFNNRSAAPLVDVPYGEMTTYYEAYRRFAEIVARPALGVTFRLAPGDLFIVDNTRVLHARKGYAGAGTRWLQGCYADKDGLLSTLAVIEEERTKC